MRFKPKDKVVVPVDFSDSSVDAVKEALRCAASPESVHVVHVVFDLEPIAPYGYWNEQEPEWFVSRYENAKKHLEEFITEHEFGGVAPVVLSGDAGREITKYADEQKADLIVMPSHGYHGFNRLLLGSTTERVLRHAHCPVYVLRRRDAE